MLTKLLQFLSCAYLYSINTTKPKTISSMLSIRETQVFDWATNPLWILTTKALGCRGEVKMKGLEKHRKSLKTNVRNYHAQRLNRIKNQALRNHGMLSPDLAKAERLWTKMFTSKEVHND